MIIGIDPSQRHTGICFLTEAGARFDEIKPVGDLLSSFREVRKRMEAILSELPFAGNLLIGIEKQLSVGGQSSGTMLVMQTAIYDAIYDRLGNSARLVSPLPVQLQKYVREKHDGPKGRVTPTDMVRHYKAQTGDARRISIHCVDAFYLACMARDVEAGRWQYPLPTKEAPLHPWKILNGGSDGSGQTPGDPQEG